ncbi:hypothetical protein Tco_0762189 [Tanacetum coccineum]
MDDVQETAKVDDDKDTAELQSLMEVILDEEEVIIDVIPLSTKPLLVKGIVFRKPGESTTTTTPIPSKIQDKGKAKMIEPKPVKKLSKKYQLKLDEEIALKLQAEIDEEERIARAKEEKIDEANIA